MTSEDVRYAREWAVEQAIKLAPIGDLDALMDIAQRLADFVLAAETVPVE